MLGDKAYSSRAIRSHLRRRRITATIPEPADQTKNRLRRGSKGGRPPKFDAEDYKQRNVVERAINKLKGHRAVATRYDKRDHMFRSEARISTLKRGYGWNRARLDDLEGAQIWAGHGVLAHNVVKIAALAA